MKQYELAFKILSILADGYFHSGEALASSAGCSRVTIWKAIAQLKDLGINVFSVKKKGYRLQHKLNILNESEIQKELGELNQFVNFELIQVIESTNSFLNQSSDKKPHATVVAANIQTKGKGRRGRMWQAKIGESLALSILWKFDRGASMLSGLSLVVGLALQRLMQKLGLQNTFLKWPNDLLIKQGENLLKMAGVLIELQGDMESRCSAIIGIGFNYELSKETLKIIDQPAIGIKDFLNQDIQPNQLIAMIIREVIDALSEFEKNGFMSMKDEWLTYNAFKNTHIKFKKSNGEEVIGEIVDLEPDGSLMLKKNDGSTESLMSGEVTQVK
ncbi:MAG: biotin--[acetyl-CoA-carboxylase] ligase [Pelagibacteraceae bacterium]